MTDQPISTRNTPSCVTRAWGAVAADIVMADVDPPVTPVRTLPLYKAAASAVRTGHAGFVFSCSEGDDKLCLHDTNSGDPIISLDAPAENPTMVAVSSDAEKAAYGTTTGAVYVWDVLYPTSMESFRPDDDAVSEVTSLAWHPRGHVLAVATASGTVYLWDLVVGALLYPLPAHAGRATAVAWTANGRLLVTVGDDAALRVWNPRNVDNLGELTSESEDKPDVKWHTSPIRALDTLYDLSRVAVSGADDGSVLLSVLKPEAMCGVFHVMTPHKAAISAVRFAPLDSPKPLRAASAAVDGSVHLFDMDRRLPMGRFSHKRGPVRQLTFSGHADILFSAAADTVVAWDARVAPDEERPVTFGVDSPAVSSFALINSGSGLVTACGDGCLRVYDVRYPYGEVPPVDQIHASRPPS